eukprot:scaffold10608_cov179-Ochromonas_danica.AAC.3
MEDLFLVMILSSKVQRESSNQPLLQHLSGFAVVLCVVVAPLWVRCGTLHSTVIAAPRYSTTLSPLLSKKRLG